MDTNLDKDIYELQVKDWDRYLTPWKTEGRFKGEAKVILDVIETR